jgi:hypothetical protein
VKDTKKTMHTHTCVTSFLTRQYEVVSLPSFWIIFSAISNNLVSVMARNSVYTDVFVYCEFDQLKLKMHSRHVQYQRDDETDL